MKKLLAILLITGATVGAYFYFRGPPQFSGPYANLKTYLWRYSREKDFAQRYTIAHLIMISPALETLRNVTVGATRLLEHSDSMIEQHDRMKRGEPITPEDRSKAEEAQKKLSAPLDSALELSEKENQIYEEAKAFFKETQNRLERFENSLTSADITFVTQENPESIYRKIGYFPPRGECEGPELESLKATMTTQELQARVPIIMGLAQAYESEFFPSYSEKKAELLDQDERFQEDRDLAQIYTTPLFSPKSRTGVDENTIRAHEEKLVTSGVSRAKVRAYVYEMASRFPICLGRWNFEFIERLRKEAEASPASYTPEK